MLFRIKAFIFTFNRIFEQKKPRDLDLNDMLVYSIPENNTDIKNISEEDCFMYGIILGDGCMNNNDQNGYISLHTFNKKHLLESIKQANEGKTKKINIKDLWK
jgi:hypothetical protein